MGRSTVHEIINETCEAIWQALQPDFMKPPTRQDWEQIEKGFRLKWHFPNCVGALDGKHISIKAPPKSREAVFNYRLSREHMVVENAFGILVQRWHIFDRKIPLSECNVDSVVKAACVLHNYLTEEKDIDEIFAQLNPMRERFLTEDGVACLYMPWLNGYRSTRDAQGVRDIFKGYF